MSAANCLRITPARLQRAQRVAVDQLVTDYNFVRSVAVVDVDRCIAWLDLGSYNWWGTDELVELFIGYARHHRSWLP